MLIGREIELHRVDALLAAARLGRSGVLVVSGHPGIGKTTLLRAVAERASDVGVHLVTGTQVEQDLPFAGLAHLLRLSAADLARLPPPQAEALGVALALWPGSGVDRFAVGAGLLTLLAERSAVRPLCLLVDDAHWLDQPSQDALLFVARRLLADPIALVIGVRSGEPCRLADATLPSLTLGPLEPAAARDLARSTSGSLTGPGLDQVLTLAEGNPLAIRELAADPLARRFDPLDLSGSLPESLTAAYARRTLDLGPESATAARCAAVAGEDLPTIRRVCEELGVSGEDLAAVESAGLLRLAADRVEFRHPLVRSALYTTADPELRRRLHAATARALDPRDDRRVWHLSAAVIGPDETVAAGLDRLTSRSADRGAYAVAATAADRAADLSPAAPARDRRRLEAATWAWHAGEPARAEGLARAVVDQGRGRARHRARHLLGVITARSGAMDQARDTFLAAAAEATAVDDRLASLSEAIYACYYLGDAHTAVDAAGRIERLLDDAPEGARARAAIAAGCARILAGGDGEALIRRGLGELSPEMVGTDPGLAPWAVVGPLFLRDEQGGRDVMRQVVGARRARSALGDLPHLLFHVARDQAGGEAWDRAESDYSEAVALARELGQGAELTASLAGLAWLEARRGRSDDCRRHAAEATELARRHHLAVMEVWARWADADLMLGHGDVATARTRYREVETLLDSLGLADVDLSPGPELAECELRLGSAGAARDLVADYERRAALKGRPWAAARAARGLASFVADREIDAAYGTALQLHDQTLDLYERARTLLAYGSRLRRARRRVDARPVLQQAVSAFSRLGAQPWVEAAADELAATGATVRRPGESPLARLTDRETQIVLLLVEGRSTRETASALFLSPKTVEYHLRNVYTKLGISSRAELQAVLAR